MRGYVNNSVLAQAFQTDNSSLYDVAQVPCEGANETALCNVTVALNGGVSGNATDAGDDRVKYELWQIIFLGKSGRLKREQIFRAEPGFWCLLPQKRQ